MLVALFPSMILWSVLNIRDAIATLGVTILVYMAVRLHRASAAVRRGLPRNRTDSSLRDPGLHGGYSSWGDSVWGWRPRFDQIV